MTAALKLNSSRDMGQLKGRPDRIVSNCTVNSKFTLPLQTKIE